jgi:hypothetical protein
MLSLVRLDEIHHSERFPRGHDRVSSCRLVMWAQASAGKRYGTSGTKIGKASLTWAFSEATVLCLRNHPAGQQSRARIEKRHGKGKALTVLAHRWARAVYDMLQRGVTCDLHAFLQRSGRGGGEPATSQGHDGRAWQPCAASIPSGRRRTSMSPEALDPDPARVMGRLLPLR